MVLSIKLIINVSPFISSSFILVDYSNDKYEKTGNLCDLTVANYNFFVSKVTLSINMRMSVFHLHQRCFGRRYYEPIKYWYLTEVFSYCKSNPD